MYQRKDGVWADSVKLPGMKRPKSFYGATKAEVKKKMAAYTAAYEKGKTFAALADEWDTAHRLDVSPNAHATYIAPLRRAVEFFGDTPVNDITAAEVKAFIKKMAGQGFAKRTVQLHRDMLNMIFDFGIQQENSTLKYNPVSSVKTPKNLKTTRRLPPTDKQLEKVQPDTASDMGLFAYFVLYTGLRRGELLGLRWEDIDRKNKLISVSREIIYESNQPKVVDHTKTEAGIRSVDLVDVLLAILPDKKCGYLFPRDGEDAPLTKTQFRKRWIEFCKEIGEVEVIEEKHHSKTNNRTYVKHSYKPLMTPHQFRHAYASLLDDAGIDDNAAKNMLGHKQISTTKDIYTHIRQSKKQRALDTLNKHIAQNAARSDDVISTAEAWYNCN